MKSLCVYVVVWQKVISVCFAMEKLFPSARKKRFEKKFKIYRSGFNCWKIALDCFFLSDGWLMARNRFCFLCVNTFLLLGWRVCMYCDATVGSYSRNWFTVQMHTLGLCPPSKSKMDAMWCCVSLLSCESAYGFFFQSNFTNILFLPWMWKF